MHGNMLQKPLDEITNDDDLIKAILHLYNISYDGNKGEIQRWKENTGYARGNYNYNKKPPPIANARSKPTRSLQKDIISPKLKNVAALLSRGIPSVQIQALQPDELAYIAEELDVEYNSDVPADALQQLIQGEWKQRHENVFQKKIIDECLIAGTTFRAFSVQPDLYRGNKIYSKILLRDQILLDPETTMLETLEDCRWIFLLSEMSASEIEYRWGLKEKDYAGGTVENKIYSENSGQVRMIDQYDAKGNRIRKAEMVTYPVWCLFWKPGQPDILRFNDGDKKQRDLRGRMFTVINKTKIAEKPSDRFALDLMGYYPIVSYTHDPIVNTFSGYSMVNSLKGPQDFVNILYNSIAKNAMARGGYTYLAEPGMVKQKNITLGANMFIPVGVGALSEGKVQEMSPGDIGTSIANFMQMEISDARELAGDPSGTVAGVVNSAVKSGKHANTILESASTLFSQYISNVDVGHSQAAQIEILMSQQQLDFSHEYYNRRYKTNRLPFLPQAMKELLFKIEILSKSNLPATSLSAEINWYTSLVQMGYMSIYDYMKTVEMIDKLDPVWVAKMKEGSENAIPGEPPQLTAEMNAQRRATADQSVDQLSALVGEGSGGAEQIPAGQGGQDEQ